MEVKIWVRSGTGVGRDVDDGAFGILEPSLSTPDRTQEKKICTASAIQQQSRALTDSRTRLLFAPTSHHDVITRALRSLLANLQT